VRVWKTKFFSDQQLVAEQNYLCIAPVAPEIIPGRPPKIEANNPMMKAAYSPTRGSTPATNAKAIASGTKASDTVIPDRISVLNDL